MQALSPFKKGGLGRGFYPTILQDLCSDGCSSVEKAGNPNNNPDVALLYTQLAPVRDHLAQASAATQRSVWSHMGPGSAMGVGDMRRVDTALQHATLAPEHESAACHRVQELGQIYPVLLDPDLDLHSLGRASQAELAELVGGTTANRLENIRDARQTLTDDPESIWDADGAIQSARQSLSIQPGSVYARIIDDKLRHRAQPADPRPVPGGAGDWPGAALGRHWRCSCGCCGGFCHGGRHHRGAACSGIPAPPAVPWQRL